MPKQPPPEITPVQWKPLGGGLTSDIDERDMRSGDLHVKGINTGALNMRTVGKGSNVSPDYETIIGNEHAYTLDEVVLQSKIFRLYLTILEQAVDQDISFTLSTPTGTVLATYTDVITITDIATLLSDVQSLLDAELVTYAPQITTLQTGTNSGYLEFYFDTVPMFNYFFSFTLPETIVTTSITILQEAIDPSMGGNWNLIGSNKDTGFDFQFWTTRSSAVEQIEILNITNPSGSIIRVETLTAHGLGENYSVKIEGVEGAVEANGEWLAVNVTAFTFDLANAVYVSAYVSSGVVLTHIHGLGEIGVAQMDSFDNPIYTRLLRSREFNFSTLHQIDCRVKRKQDSRYAVYFTESRGNETIENDTTNVPRVFYYKGDFQIDGALFINNDENIYDYGNISSELRWVISNLDFSLRWVNQLQAGGTVKSGNWRYAARLVTADFASTQWGQLTEGVPVFSYNYQAGSLVIGDNTNVTTPKINVLELTNNAIGLFKYVEIAAVNYIGASAFTGYIIGRYELNDQSIQTIQHTGSENAILDLDVGELNDLSPGFLKAQNVELLDNRAILSNLTPGQILDFTEFTEQIMYRLDREILSPIGVWVTNSLSSNEFQLPENVYSKKTHMMMETYRYGFKYKLKNGGITQAFYPGYDIRIDLPAALPPERVAGTFTTFDLTDSNAPPTEVYSIVINWLNIDLSRLVGGVPFFDLVDEIIPVRAKVIPEVHGHGAVVLGVDGVSGTALYYKTTDTSAPDHAIGPYPFMTAFAGGAPYPSISGWNEQRESAFFYSPDYSFRTHSMNFQNGDQLLIFGNPDRHNDQILTGPFLVEFPTYAEFNGHSGISANVTPYSILDARVIEINQPASESKTFIPVSTTINSLPHSLGLVNETFVNDSLFVIDKSFACVTSAGITNVGGNPDYGFYRAIYFRPLVNKYGDSHTTEYTEALLPYILGDKKDAIAPGDFTTQGDCFTQKTYLKFKYPGWFDRIQSGINDGGAIGFAYYAQNRNNIQLRCKPSEAHNPNGVIQQLNINAWLFFGYALPGTPGEVNAINYVAGRDAQLFYNKGYTPRNDIVATRAYDRNAIFQKDWGNGMTWSDPEADGSNTDNLRVFPAFNLKFLDYTQGPITGAYNLNGELVTVQHTAVIRQYFNTTSAITTTEGSEIVLGSGAVLSRRGSVINNYGSKHKWSMLIGLSARGQQILYGWDDVNKVVWRLGYDGTTNLEVLSGMKAFFANHMTWIKNQYTPAHDQGVRGTANERYKELIWTARGRKPVQEWTDREITTQILDFTDVLYGTEMIVNGLFQGSLYGWEQLGTPPPQMWLHWNGQGPQSAYKPSSFGTNDYLKQVTPISFTPGVTYQVKIVVYSSSGPGANSIDVKFQVPSSPQFTLGMGTHFLTYTAVAGDDNIYIDGPAATFVRITEVSVRPILSTPNWLGAPTWVIGSNMACADGTDGDNLVQDTPDYIVGGAASVTLDYVIEGVTTGDVTAVIADVSDTPRTADGSYSFVGFPTATGVVSFIPDNGFDGCVKGNMRLTTIVTKRYNEGEVVQVPGNNFHELPDLYIALTETGGTLPTPDNPDWQLIPHSNPLYYNEYTIVFSEIKNRFQLFASFLPKIFAQFFDGYLVPRPIGNTGKMYINDRGDPTTWFKDDGSVLTDVSYFDAIINMPIGRKRFLAVRVECDSTPDSMEVLTPLGTTNTPASGFTQREGGEFDAPVYNMADASGVTTGDTSVMQSDWARFRFITRATAYNRYNNFIAKVRQRARKWFT